MAFVVEAYCAYRLVVVAFVATEDDAYRFVIVAVASVVVPVATK